MSMFNVGDLVLYEKTYYTYEVVKTTITNVFALKHSKTKGIYAMPHISRLRLATPEEVAVGHRIESSNSQAISNCSLSNLCKNDTQNSLSIKQENHDMGDDSHIENHISPNCKKFDERVNGNETN